MYVITINRKPATVQQLHKHEGWTWNDTDIDHYRTLPTSYIAARTARDCRAAYDALLGIAWTQKQWDVRCERVKG